MQKNTRKKRKLIFLFAIKRRTHGSGSIINSTSPDYKRLRRSCLLQSPNFDGIQGNWCRKELKGRLTRISRIANFLVSFDVAHSCESEVPWFYLRQRALRVWLMQWNGNWFGHDPWKLRRVWVWKPRNGSHLWKIPWSHDRQRQARSGGLRSLDQSFRINQ